MSPVKYMKALLGIKDVEAFWEAREEILKTGKKHILVRIPLPGPLCRWRGERRSGQSADFTFIRVNL